MTWTKAEIQAKIKDKLKQALLNETRLKAKAKSMEKMILKMIIDRIQNKIDLYGQRFGGYNRSYQKSRAYSYLQRRGETFTKYASTSNPLQLTGQLLSGIQVRLKKIDVKKTQVNIVWAISVPGQDDKVEGLQSTVGTARNRKKYAKKAWYFLGISRQLGEDRKILNELVQFLKKSDIKQVFK